MLDFSRYKFWFVTGSQHLYGPEAIEEVGRHSQTMVQALNEDKSIPFEIVFKPVLTTPEDIWRLVAEAKASGAAVTAEVTPHHLFLTDEALAGYDASAKVNPPLGTEEDRQALRRALAEGIVDVVASDHAPHAPEEKEAELDQAPFGAVGLETMLALVLGHLVREGVLSPMQAVAAVTSKPAAVLGLPGGRLAEGAVGDITLFDPAGRWEVDPARLHSIGKNTPFAGWRLEGRPVGTVVGGRVVMLEGELLDVRG